MKKFAEVYKLVSRLPSGEYASAIINDNVSKNPYSDLDNATLKKFQLKYTVGQWTKPIVENSRIFVFGDLASAKDFLDHESSDGNPLLIFRALAKDAIKNPNFMRSRNLNYLGDFWNLKKSKKSVSKVLSLAYVPQNTLFAKEVKLIQEIV